jgi:hypothetical protein
VARGWDTAAMRRSPRRSVVPRRAAARRVLQRAVGGGFRSSFRGARC